MFESFIQNKIMCKFDILFCSMQIIRKLHYVFNVKDKKYLNKKFEWTGFINYFTFVLLWKSNYLDLLDINKLGMKIP